MREHIRRHIRLATALAERVDAHPKLVLAASRSLGLVCFRHAGGDAPTQTLMDALNGSGALAVSHTRVNSQLVVRMAVGGRLTEATHVDAAWDRIVAHVGR